MKGYSFYYKYTISYSSQKSKGFCKKSVGEMRGFDGRDSYQRVAVGVDPYEHAGCFGWIYAIFSRNKTVREKKLRLASVPVSCP